VLQLPRGGVLSPPPGQDGICPITRSSGEILIASGEVLIASARPRFVRAHPSHANPASIAYWVCWLCNRIFHWLSNGQYRGRDEGLAKGSIDDETRGWRKEVSMNPPMHLLNIPYTRPSYTSYLPLPPVLGGAGAGAKDSAFSVSGVSPHLLDKRQGIKANGPGRKLRACEKTTGIRCQVPPLEQCWRLNTDPKTWATQQRAARTLRQLRANKQ
jgi:hypothetical protein